MQICSIKSVPFWGGWTQCAMFVQCNKRVATEVPGYWLRQVNICCLTDGADVLYNKFTVDSSSPPDNPPQHPNSDHNCVVATTGQWRVLRCDQQHHVVCQKSPPGIKATCSYFTVASSFVSSGFLISSGHFVHRRCNNLCTWQWFCTVLQFDTFYNAYYGHKMKRHSTHTLYIILQLQLATGNTFIEILLLLLRC